MKIIYEGIEYEWLYGSKNLYDSLMLINPKEKIFLNGNGSGINRMVEIRLIKAVEFEIKKKKTPMQV